MGSHGEKEIIVEAVVDQLETVTEFINGMLSGVDVGSKVLFQLQLVVEEIFVNIASYAYVPKTGNVTIKCLMPEQSEEIELTFIDEGIPYDPLQREEPDMTQSLEQRQIGGLGIFLTKKMVDYIQYRREDGKNILTLRKKLQ